MVRAHGLMVKMKKSKKPVLRKILGKKKAKQAKKSPKKMKPAKKGENQDTAIQPTELKVFSSKGRFYKRRAAPAIKTVAAILNRIVVGLLLPVTGSSAKVGVGVVVSAADGEAGVTVVAGGGALATEEKV